MAINLADDAAPDPRQLARLRKSLEGRESVPTTRHQAYSYQFFQKLTGELGNPYDLTRIPISVLKQMERDPIISFALYFIHVPIIRAKWHIECPDARVAAFVDNSLRRILASYIRHRKQAMVFGFKPLVKRFQLEIPNWKYLDPAKSDDELKVWTNSNIEAITWKPFIGLPSDPTTVEPRWTEKGEFNGIKYNGGANLIPFQVQDSNEDGGLTVPVTHALWITNEREGADGSLWGFPRIGYAYRYWWSYWFRWALFDRFFERKSDPPYVVYYPVGRSGDFAGDGETDPDSMRDIALSIAESARAGGALAMPGDVISGAEDRPTQMREWEIQELEVHGDMNHFTESFEYLDIMKLRALWISEFAVTEGQGGTSSRNTMGEQLEFQKEGAGALADEIDDELNRWVIPDIVRANFPNFKGDCRKVTTSFAESDHETMQQALQWIGQSDASALRNIDVRQLLDRLGMPVLSHAEIRRQEEKAQEALEEAVPEEIATQNGNANISPQGFYVQPREIIKLADESSSEFLAKLPPSKHYQDRTIRNLSVGLRTIWKEGYKDIYEDFAKHISEFNLSDEMFIDVLNLDAKLVPNKPGVTNWVEKLGGLPKPIADMAGDLISERGFSTSHAIATAVSQAKKLCAKGNKKYCRAIAQWEKMKARANMSLADEDRINKVVKRWNYPKDRLERLVDESQQYLKKIVNRAGNIELRDSGFPPKFDLENEDVANWLEQRGLEFVSAADDTVREELRTYLANAVAEGIGEDEIADGVREHFEDWPDWKADRLVRSEIRNSYNFATLNAGEQAGVKFVQALDAQKGQTDAECAQRNGKFYEVREAFAEIASEHPNGTLEFRLIPGFENLSTKRVEKMPNGSNSLGYFDNENSIIYLANDIPLEVEQTFLVQLGDTLINKK